MIKKDSSEKRVAISDKTEPYKNSYSQLVSRSLLLLAVFFSLLAILQCAFQEVCSCNNRDSKKLMPKGIQFYSFYRISL